LHWEILAFLAILITLIILMIFFLIKEVAIGKKEKKKQKKQQEMIALMPPEDQQKYLAEKAEKEARLESYKAEKEARLERQQARILAEKDARLERQQALIFAAKAEKEARLERQQSSITESIGYRNPQYGGINTAMVCPHCQSIGKIRTKEVTQKKGVSGGKATAAVLTGGLSLFAVGLSRKEGATQAHCDNCHNTWFF